VSVPAVVLASHQFPDVPDSHPFHAEIGLMAEAGITAGFGDGGYHPSEAVTRQAMAAFLGRGLGHGRMDVGSATQTPSVFVDNGETFSVFYVVRKLTVIVPGATNEFSPNQYVYLHGTITFLDAMSNAGSGCPCEFTAGITDATTNTSSSLQAQTFESSNANPFLRTFTVETFLPATPGEHEYQLVVQLSNRASTTNAGNFAFDNTSSLTAISLPFQLETPDLD
jgi:hypothetical protein